MSCEYRPSDLSYVVCCIHDRLPVPMVCALTSRPVGFPDRPETNIECRLLDMRIWWCVTSFAVGDRTVGAMDWQMWHEPSVNFSRRHKAFFSELYRLGYRWHCCMSSFSLMVLHTNVLVCCRTSTSTYSRNKVTINMALTCMIFDMLWHI